MTFIGLWFRRGQSFWTSSKSHLLVIVIAIATVIAGCQQRTDETAFDIEGVWIAIPQNYFLEFRETGVFSFADKFDTLATGTTLVGDYKMEGNVLTYETSDDSNNCPGIVGIFEIEISETGELKQTSIDDACTDRRRTFEINTWARYTP